MTDEAINEVIARWMGWRKCTGKRHINCSCSRGLNPPWMHKPEWPGGRDFGPHSTAVQIPDFCASLDALAPVLAKLTAEQWDRFIHNPLRDNPFKGTLAQFYLTLKPRQIAAAVAEVIQQQTSK